MGVLAVSALVVLTTLTGDMRLHGEERRHRDAREVAQGGLMEVMNHGRLLQKLPSAAGDTARVKFGRPTSSEFWDSAERAKYAAKATLVRSAPALESSQRRVRAVIYQVKVRGKMSTGETADVESYLYRLAAAPTNRAAVEVYGK